MSTVPFSIEPFRFNCCRFICFNCLRLVRRLGFISLLNFGTYFHQNPGFSATGRAEVVMVTIRSSPISKGGGPYELDKFRKSIQGLKVLEKNTSGYHYHRKKNRLFRMDCLCFFGWCSIKLFLGSSFFWSIVHSSICWGLVFF